MRDTTQIAGKHTALHTSAPLSRFRVRAVEWLLFAYFAYVAVLAWILPLKNPSDSIRAVAVFGIVVGVYATAIALSRITRHIGFEIFRDWITLGFTIAAYRAMDWFTPATYSHTFENYWIVWDRKLLDAWHFRYVLEFTGPAFPSLLELCYLVVYAVGPFTLGALYWTRHRHRAPRLLLLYEMGTLLSYACFPFFPSEPPRSAFAGLDLPHIANWIRHANLGVVNGYGIHSSVFPSAHVSSAFAAAFAMMLSLPRRPWYGRLMLVYAILVALAVIYGRYHYAIDAVAGIAVSLIALAICSLIERRRAHS